MARKLMTVKEEPGSCDTFSDPETRVKVDQFMPQAVKTTVVFKTVLPRDCLFMLNRSLEKWPVSV